MNSRLNAYVFWHRPLTSVDQEAYEASLVVFHAELAKRRGNGFAGSATYRLSGVPWLAGTRVYEDWNFIESSAALDGLNETAVAADMWDTHAGISSKTDEGHGGLYYHIVGERNPAALARTAWLTRPRGIRYQAPLAELVRQIPRTMSVWRKQMVLGPAPEFAILGDTFIDLDLPQGWTAHYADRTLLHVDTSGE